MTIKKTSFLYKNGLSISLIFIFMVLLFAQFLVGWQTYNHILTDHSALSIPFSAYLFSGHCWQATFENWESEFLQMFAYVIMTVYFKQQGSSESKPLNKPASVDKPPRSHPTAPWPVKKGGWILGLYKNSLSLAFLLLFFISFIFHAYGSYKFFATEQALNNKPVPNWESYLFSARFWFESFQNWQSEFLAVASIVVLSIFLRQFGSPESKPVDMPHLKNE